MRALILLTPALLFCASLPAQRPILENLSRGVVAVHQPDGKVFVSWRLLATDPADVAFNVYRTTAPGPNRGGPPGRNVERGPSTSRLNETPITGATWVVDSGANLALETAYFVRAVSAGAEGPPSKSWVIRPGGEPVPYHAVPLRTPEGYTPNDASLGDLDGDGDYEIVLKQEQTPRDNSQAGLTGQTLLQAYKTDGTYLWTINLGRNIREGAHYTMFMVIDLDGDGRAEVACKTADGTVDGTGKIIGDPNADWRESGEATAPTRDRTGSTQTSDGRLVARLKGRILRGPEYLTVFDGRTGAALATEKYIPGRHPETDNPTGEQLRQVWGDAYANRSDRFLAGVAYLDGRLPSLLFCRGYYTRAVIAAWDFRGGKLTSRWVFDSDDGTPGNEKFRGQGNHQLSVADVDGDGRQEVIYGAAVIDDDGKGLYSTGWGHGDALHVSDFHPENPGLEVLTIQERFDREGMSLRDARTGKPLVLVPSVRAATEGGDRGEGPGRGIAANIDPRFPGAELWCAGAGMDGIFNAQGEKFLDRRPRGMPCNFAVWWDGDLLRELLDGNRILKWNWETGAVDPLLVAHTCTSANGTKSTPAVSADLWGDWREEVIWATRDGRELRIHTSTIPTKHRLFTLMHDAQYRVAIAWQNTAYNQPPHPSFALDDSLPLPRRPDIDVPDSRISPMVATPPRPTVADGLAVSTDQRHLVNALTGEPVFLLADTAWNLAALKLDEVGHYFRNRVSHGFNTIMFTLNFDPQASELNAYGHAAYIGPEKTDLNPDFFRYCDAIVASAAEHGLYLMIYTMWAGEKAGTMNRYTPAQLATIGHALGRRYAGVPHVILCAGGEASPHYVDVARVEALGRALKEGSAGRNLVTVHPVSGHASADFYAAAPWIDFHLSHAKSSLARASTAFDAAALVLGDQAVRPVRPTMMAEHRYESGIDEDPLIQRRSLYQCVFAGAFGHAYGHNALWQMTPHTAQEWMLKGWNPGVADWAAALDTPAVSQLRHVRRLLHPRPRLATRHPAQELVLAGQGSSVADRVQVMRDGTPGRNDATCVAAYLSSPRAVTLDTTPLAAPRLVLTWFDPPTGLSESGQTPFDNTGRVALDARPRGFDWVAVIEPAPPASPAAP